MRSAKLIKSENVLSCRQLYSALITAHLRGSGEHPGHAVVLHAHLEQTLVGRIGVNGRAAFEHFLTQTQNPRGASASQLAFDPRAVFAKRERAKRHFRIGRHRFIGAKIDLKRVGHAARSRHRFGRRRRRCAGTYGLWRQNAARRNGNGVAVHERAGRGRGRVFNARGERNGFQTLVVNADDGNVIIFHHGIGEQLATHLVEFTFHRCRLARQLNGDVFADANVGHAGVTELLQRFFNSLALRIEQRGFERDVDFCESHKEKRPKASVKRPV